MIKTCWPHLENPFLRWGLCRFVMFCVVFDKQLSDLALFTSHLNPFKLQWTSGKKKKKKEGTGRRRGYPVAQHPGDLDLNSDFLSPPILEKLWKQLLNVACHLVAIQQWPLHKPVVGLMRTKLQIPSVLHSVKDGRRLHGSLRC